MAVADGGDDGEAEEDGVDEVPAGVGAVGVVVADAEHPVAVLGEHLLEPLHRVRLVVLALVQRVRRDVVLDVLDQLGLGRHHVLHVQAWSK